MTSVRAGADIGCTFTDIVVIAADGGVLVAKVASRVP
jgi:N-methylhydantoinase A/oxoprolinase/acetone carboxylase beta subunit